jgi:aspartate/methionine/tyrosine aminotransferase
MNDSIKNSVELLSLNSISKGMLGECGLRGGYMETTNFDPFVSD